MASQKKKLQVLDPNLHPKNPNLHPSFDGLNFHLLVIALDRESPRCFFTALKGEQK